MKLDASSKNLDSLIEQYNRELMRFYEQNASRVQPAVPQSPDMPQPRRETAAEPIRETAEAPCTPLDGEARVAYPGRIVEPPPEPESEPAAAIETAPQTAAPPMRSVDELLETDFPLPEPYVPEPVAEAPQPQRAPEVKFFPFTGEEGTLPGVPLVDTFDERPAQRQQTPAAPETAVPDQAETAAGRPLVEHPNNMSIGYLQIRTFSAREAEPIADALITVTRQNGDGEEELYVHTTTDRDGFTDIFPLPAVDSELTLEPGIPSPYTSYNIQAQAPGYFRVLNVNAPVYGGNTAVQPVSMIPIPEFELSPQDLVFFQSGPQDL